MTAGVAPLPFVGAERVGTPRAPVSRALPAFPRVIAQVFIVVALVLSFDAIRMKPRGHYLVVLFGFGALLLAFRQLLAYGRIVLPMLLYIVFAIASLAWSVQPSFTMRDLRVTEAMVLSIMLVASLLPVETLTRTVVIGIEVVCLATVYYLMMRPTTRWLDPTNAGAGVAWRGGFDHKNNLAMFGAFFIPWLLAFELRRRRRILFVMLLFAFVLGSRSATGLIGLVVALFTWSWVGLMQRRAPRSRAVAFAVTVPLAIVACIGAWLSLSSIASALGKDLTLTGRTRIWSALLPKIGEKPLAGWGPSALYGGGVNPWNRDVILKAGFFHPHSHNALFEIVLALGIVGVVLVGALLVSIFYGAARLFDRAPNVARWALASTVSLVVMSVAERTFTIAGWFAAVVIIRLVEVRVDPRAPARSREAVDRRITHGRLA